MIPEQYKYTTPQLEPGDFKISPSGFAQSLYDPRDWHKNNILGESTFQGNTNSIIGTCIHKRIECIMANMTFNTSDELAYLQDRFDQGLIDLSPENAQAEVIRLMDAVEQEYCNLYTTTLNEWEVKHRYKDRFVIAGTIDAISEENGNTYVTDYKTSGITPKTISVAYYMQAMLYCIALKETTKYTPTHIRIVYIVKLKKVPKVVVLEREITQADYDFMTNQLDILIKKIDLIMDYQSLVSVLFNINPLSYGATIDNFVGTPKRMDLADEKIEKLSNLI